MIELNFNEEDEWYLEEEFEKIKKFRETGIYSTANSKDSNGYIGIYVKEYNFEEPQDFQKNALNFFYDNQDKVLDALCTGIIQHYPKLMDKYNVKNFDTELGFPELKSINEVKKIIGIGNIHILHYKKNNYSYIGFECGCPWDEEHGLGVIMYKDRVIDVGSADISLSGSKELRKDNGTYTEEERIRDEKWAKKIAENIAKYKREQEKLNE